MKKVLLLLITLLAFKLVGQSAPISKWRLAKEHALGLKDYFHGIWLSKPENYERNYEPGFKNKAGWWSRAIADRVTGDENAPEGYYETVLNNPKLAKYVYRYCANEVRTPQMRRILERHPQLVDAPLGVTDMTPLYRAVSERNPEAVKMLLNAGADVNAKVTEGDYYSPLSAARLFVRNSNIQLESLEAQRRMMEAYPQESMTENETMKYRDLEHQIGEIQKRLAKEQKISNLLQKQATREYNILQTTKQQSQSVLNARMPQDVFNIKKVIN